MRERGGWAVTDGGLRVVGRGSFGELFGVGAGTKGPSSTASRMDEASTPMPTEPGECGVGVVVRAACDGGACSRACAAEGRGQVVLARGGGCVRACECAEAGW
jgi:hypothetical protein